MVIAVPFLVSLAGLVVYLAARDAKVQECGRTFFWVGLLVGLWRVAGVAVSVLH